ncbi:DUF397 domain-containing protein [Streptomyces sp. SCA3-4]|uniref:DUF397 domain-containing protein n=1 Tax=Streptomyces sichuanensis TaxID=2871810 RepID=UPI001CE2751A|nr:DUF397 domain-containing protein [Streptomyces sichuanensis]MCA6092297.1 DUF397 domain-containing protein [Streptomyces sichuanensis]
MAMSYEPTWFKSSYSDSSIGDCVEVATPQAMVHIRDSKLGSADDHPRITISPASWAAFTAELRGSGVERPL